MKQHIKKVNGQYTISEGFFDKIMKLVSGADKDDEKKIKDGLEALEKLNKRMKEVGDQPIPGSEEITKNGKPLTMKDLAKIYA